MRIVIAPDSFKGSMTATEVADAMERGIQNICETCSIVKVPLADGGEGMATILSDHLNAKTFEAEVMGPLGEKVIAAYGIAADGTAIIDVASVIGLQFVPEEKRNPLETTSYGVGELIIDAIDNGAKRFIIGLGGSSTNDGGIGMVQALGAQITDKSGSDVMLGGKGLLQIANISASSIDTRLRHCSFVIASDVTNPLLGERGATYVYGPQKGATKKMLTELERGMKNYASVLERNLQVDVTEIEGVGAAGGLGAAFRAFLDAEIKSGVDYVMELTNLEKEIAQADIVLTGEGKIDSQTLHGKVPFGVAQLSKEYGIPVISIVGANELSSKKMDEMGVRAVFPIVQKPMSLNEALQNSEYLIEQTVENVFRLITNEGDIR